MRRPRGRADLAGITGDLRIEGLHKAFGGFTAVDNLSLTVPRGSFFALLGPSGCGKTTTLRMVAGLEEPTAGRIALGDTDITGLRPFHRPVNTVFQSYALFPHLDIFENVAFGLRRLRRSEIPKRVGEALELVELGHLARRRPGELSGGQQQRVALARAIVNRPALLLLDEPLGALDLKLRRQMQIELKRIQTEVGITFVHVTHDQEEAMTMADTIAVMNGGRVEQLGDPTTLYENPRTTFVANFLGQSNLLRATIGGRSGSDVLVDVHGHRVLVPADRAVTRSGDVWLGVRPEKMSVRRPLDLTSTATTGPGSTGGNVLSGTVTDTSFVGVSTQYLVRLPWGQEIMVFAQNLGREAVLRPGDEAELRWHGEHAFVLDASQDALAGARLDLDAVAPDPVGARV